MAYENYRRECKRAMAHALDIPYRTKNEQLENRDLLSHYSTHSVRSTFASLLYDSGRITDRQLQKLMGHTTSDMTRRYCHDIRSLQELQEAQITAFAGIGDKK